MTEICPVCEEEFWQEENQVDYHRVEVGPRILDVYEVVCPNCEAHLQWVEEYELTDEYLAEPWVAVDRD